MLQYQGSSFLARSSSDLFKFSESSMCCANPANLVMPAQVLGENEITWNDGL